PPDIYPLSLHDALPILGTLSVRAPDKQRHFEATRMLERMAEPLAAISGIDAAKGLDQAWTLILQNAAHDTACGSGIDAVAEASRDRKSTRLNSSHVAIS